MQKEREIEDKNSK